MDEELMSYSQLMSHASSTAHDYLMAAIDSVEKLMGKGASQQYPELVAELVRAATADYSAAMMSHRIAPSLDRIARGLDEIADALRSARVE